MHAGVVAARERAVDLKVAALAATGVGKAAFKKVAGEAVRARDVRAMRRQARSTVLHHLRVLGDPARHMNQLQKYLTALEVHLSAALESCQLHGGSGRRGVLALPSA